MPDSVLEPTAATVLRAPAAPSSVRSSGTVQRER